MLGSLNRLLRRFFCPSHSSAEPTAFKGGYFPLRHIQATRLLFFSSLAFSLSPDAIGVATKPDLSKGVV